jgi:hypothetical protein
MPEPGGTRFLLYPQAPWRPGYARPETVALKPRPGVVRQGPADRRIYTIAAAGKRYPYGVNATPYGSSWLYLPPWDGPIAAPARPDRRGHFDHLRPTDPEFELAHAYGCVRFALEVWERYLGRPVAWHFAADRPRLEIGLLPSLANASAGYGYIEVGTMTSAAGATSPLGLNFDVLAHELGHLIVFALLGTPPLEAVEDDWFGMQESLADLVALIACTHFDSVLVRLLASTRGNLYAPNELNAFAELDTVDRIRDASNPRRLREFAAGWDDEHDLSEPLTGAVFDTWVDL